MRNLELTERPSRAEIFDALASSNKHFLPGQLIRLIGDSLGWTRSKAERLISARYLQTELDALAASGHVFVSKDGRYRAIRRG
ncbi:MAG: hypothetical protein M3M85_03640 [bacterium]|nr:hypothetical protein [bacterium]